MTVPTYTEIKKAVAVLERAGWWSQLINQGSTTRIQLRSHAVEGAYHTIKDVILALRSTYDRRKTSKNER